jgi:F-type H+-transporting ATPase subunit b
MDLVTPGIGLVFWTTVVFGLLLFLLSKFAWKPILGAVKEREENIEKSLQVAEKARNEMRELQSINEKLAADARIERDAMLKEAREIREQMISEAKGKANEEAERMLTAARETIRSEKNAAVAELKNQVATLSIEIAEKILRSELSGDARQKALSSQLMEDVKLN